LAQWSECLEVNDKLKHMSDLSNDLRLFCLLSVLKYSILSSIIKIVAFFPDDLIVFHFLKTAIYTCYWLLHCRRLWGNQAGPIQLPVRDAQYDAQQGTARAGAAENAVQL